VRAGYADRVALIPAMEAGAGERERDVNRNCSRKKRAGKPSLRDGSAIL